MAKRKLPLLQTLKPVAQCAACKKDIYEHHTSSDCPRQQYPCDDKYGFGTSTGKKSYEREKFDACPLNRPLATRFKAIHP